ncbi:CHAT domain-containing protein [candidate division KSB1 bacterium]|nr:CHAT domain-containing protein [candidate division KSB1 bacterium]
MKFDVNESIAKLDIEDIGRNRYNFKFWRAGGQQDAQKPDVRITATLDRKDYFCTQMLEEILTANKNYQPGAVSGVKQRLIKSGEVLYRNLMPEALQKEFKRLNNPLLISTNDLTIPWEVLHDGEDFLSIKFRISRDLHYSGASSGSQLSISRSQAVSRETLRFLFIVNPHDPDDSLGDTYEEGENIRQLLDSTKTKVTYLSDEHATLWEIEHELMTSYDVIHYAGHIFYENRPQKVYIQLPENQKFYPDDINYIKGKPLIFLNGCQSDVVSGRCRHGDEIYQNGLSLSQTFLLRGAKGVVGTLSKVPSPQAKTFAIEFYQNALEGGPIAEAVRLARVKTREEFPDDAGFLTFVLYGHPETRIVPLPSPDSYHFIDNDGNVKMDKFTEEARRILQNMVDNARYYGSEKAEAENLLHGLMALHNENDDDVDNNSE